MFQDFNKNKKEMCYPLKPIFHIIVLLVFIQLNLGESRSGDFTLSCAFTVHISVE